ncbi:MAG: N-acetylmuramoyl-L-alanine amidase [Clostridia bacterium]|nr:N-acetylmuramoyl-L-alanine amidase [Clostridia bacterium]
MLFVLKKNSLVFGFLILSLVVFACGILKSAVFSNQQTFLPSEGRTIIIDAGHGAPDGGAVGQSGVLEKDLNLAVAKALQNFLEAGGTQVILTRSDDNGIYDVSGSIKSKKVSDIKNREKLMQESDADAFISIHMNKFPQKQYSGPQVFYSVNHDDSKKLAECVQHNMIAALSPVSEREIKEAYDSIYLLKNAAIPAILIECGFLSNDLEEKKLLDENYQKQVAWSIYCGIIQYFDDK